MKQNPLNVKRITLTVALVIALFCSCAACVRRPRMQTHSNPQPAITDGPRLDINTALTQDLEKLPGVGKVIAERIVEHRLQHGPFRRVEHLMMVRGISERKFRAIESSITVQRTP